MACIKTGARVYLEEYGQTLPADLHTVGDCVVIRMNMGMFDTEDSNFSKVGATHSVVIGSSENSYWNKREGTLVVPINNLTEL